jgi:hypothetical protein
MRAHYIAIAALAVGSAALAQPPKDEAAASTQPQQRPTQVVLAAADAAHAPAPDPAQPAAAPAKRRVARVTTCRCGDQQVDPDSQEQ